MIEDDNQERQAWVKPEVVDVDVNQSDVESAVVQTTIDFVSSGS